MIRPLRQRHRMAILALSVWLPVGFALGVALRQPVPPVSTRPVSLTDPRQYAEVWSREDLWQTNAARTRLLRDQSTSGRLAIELSPRQEIVRPDLILYWVPAGERIGSDLPDQAILLGSVGGAPLPLPSDLGGRNGALLFYSLADHEIVEASKSFAVK